MNFRAYKMSSGIVFMNDEWKGYEAGAFNYGTVIFLYFCQRKRKKQQNTFIRITFEYAKTQILRPLCRIQTKALAVILIVGSSF
jgi:hypothetical protein